MQLVVDLESDRGREVRLDLLVDRRLARAERMRDVGAHAERDVVGLAREVLREPPRLGEDLEGHRLRRLHEPGTLAVGARRAERALQALLDPLPGDDDQAEVVEAENLRRRAVGA